MTKEGAEALVQARIVHFELEEGIAWLAKCSGRTEQEIRDRLADLTGNPRTVPPPKSVGQLLAEAMGAKGKA